MRRALLSSQVAILLAGCASTGVEPPSLQPRPGEQVDPRVPVERPINDRPATPALVARLDALVAQARSGEAAFASAISLARSAAAAAGAPQSESWIAAQEALSAAIGARNPAASALGAIDALTASLLSDHGGIAPSDKEALDEAEQAVSAIDERQSAAIAAIKDRLGD
jgi:hypothetical protein